MASISNDRYISDVRTKVTLLWDALYGLIEMQAQWNALDYGTNLMDGTGDNEGITAAGVGACVFDSANALKAVMDAGSATNLARVKYN